MSGPKTIEIDVDAKPFLDEARERYADPATSGMKIRGCWARGCHGKETRAYMTAEGASCECGRPFARWTDEARASLEMMPAPSVGTSGAARDFPRAPATDSRPCPTRFVTGESCALAAGHHRLDCRPVVNPSEARDAAVKRIGEAALAWVPERLRPACWAQLLNEPTRGLDFAVRCELFLGAELVYTWRYKCAGFDEAPADLRPDPTTSLEAQVRRAGPAPEKFAGKVACPGCGGRGAYPVAGEARPPCHRCGDAGWVAESSLTKGEARIVDLLVEGPARRAIARDEKTKAVERVAAHGRDLAARTSLDTATGDDLRRLAEAEGALAWTVERLDLLIDGAKDVVEALRSAGVAEGLACEAVAAWYQAIHEAKARGRPMPLGGVGLQDMADVLNFGAPVFVDIAATSRRMAADKAFADAPARVGGILRVNPGDGRGAVEVAFASSDSTAQVAQAVAAALNGRGPPKPGGRSYQFRDGPEGGVPTGPCGLPPGHEGACAFGFEAAGEVHTIEKGKAGPSPGARCGRKPCAECGGPHEACFACRAKGGGAHGPRVGVSRGPSLAEALFGDIPAPTPEALAIQPPPWPAWCAWGRDDPYQAGRIDALDRESGWATPSRSLAEAVERAEADIAAQLQRGADAAGRVGRLRALLVEAKAAGVGR